MATLLWENNQTNDHPTFASNFFMVTSSEDIITFKDLQSGKENYYRAASRKNGEGVSKITGHWSLPIVAFTELCVYPRIMLVSLHDFNVIQILTSGYPEKYLDIKFLETELFVALTSFPSFEIILWNWRKGIILKVQKTEIVGIEQEIFVRPQKPSLIVQFSRKLNKLLIWMVHVSTDHGYLIKKQTQHPLSSKSKGRIVDFGSDGLIYLIDALANLYTIDIGNDSLDLIWEWPTGNGSFMTHLCSYSGGFMIAGPNGCIRYVSKVDNKWMEKWSYNFAKPINRMKTLIKGNLYISCKNNDIYSLEIIEGDKQLKNISEGFGYIILADLIYPLATHCVIVSTENIITTVDIITKTKVSSLVISKITCIKSHLYKPFVVVGNGMGIVYVISYKDVTKPILAITRPLDNTSILSIQITKTINQIIAVETIEGFFILEWTEDNNLDVKVFIDLNLQRLSYCTSEYADKIYVYVLIGTNNQDTILSDKVLKTITISKKNYKSTQSDYVLEEIYAAVAIASENFNTLFGIVSGKQIMHILRRSTVTWEKIGEIITVHQMPYFDVDYTFKNVITWGIDGIFSIYNETGNILKYSFPGHGRQASGINFVRLHPLKKFLITVAYSGGIRCFNLDPKLFEDCDLRNYAQRKGDDNIFVDDDNSSKNLTWVQHNAMVVFEREKNESSEAKAHIFEQFNILKEKLQKLIDINEELPSESQIPLQGFSLWKETTDTFLEVARKKILNEENRITNFIHDQERITKWIIDQTWSIMQVKGSKVRALFSDIACDNFPSIAVSKIFQEKLDTMTLMRLIEMFLSKVDVFIPWKPYTQNQLQSILSQYPTFHEEIKTVEKMRSLQTIGENISETESLIEKHKYSLSGTSTYQHIEPSSYRTDQFQSTYLQQMMTEEIIAHDDLIAMKNFFNKKYDRLKAIKKDQIEDLKKQNDRLRYIQKEISILADLKVTELCEQKFIDDPIIYSDEAPERVLNVDPSEIISKPYLSPRTLEKMREEAYIQEQNRLARLADDFWDRALMVMMDGVIERRWEDEIKKTPPKPVCLEDKNSVTDFDELNTEDFTNEELQEIQDYEANLKFLYAERKRYLFLLKAEQSKLDTWKEKLIINFNKDLIDLLLLKARVTAAIKQEEMRIIKLITYNYEKHEMNSKNEQFVKDSIQSKKIIGEMQILVEELGQKVRDCRKNYENLIIRDSMLEKQFKTQFGEIAAQPIVDQAYKIFRKRPKWTPKQSCTQTVLTELATRITSKNSSKGGLPLPPECYSFIHVIDSLDFFSNAPSTFDKFTWNTLCAMRRYKINSELTVQSCGLQLAEADETYKIFLKELANTKDYLFDLGKKIEDIKGVYMSSLLNKTVQIVLDKGAIEISLSGHLADFKGAVLCNMKDINDINGLIKKVSQAKIRSMQRSAIFRRQINTFEWQHKVLSMSIEDIQESLDTIDSIQMTKDMQDWIKNKKKGIIASSVKTEEDEIDQCSKEELRELEKEIEELTRKITTRQRENKILDKKIKDLHLDIQEQNIASNPLLEEAELIQQKARLALVSKRDRLVRKVKAQHTEIMELSEMLEMQRLRTYPTFNTPI